MTDETFGLIYNYMKNYNDLEDFKKRYIDVEKPKNADLLIDFFQKTQDKNITSESVEMIKFFISAESLRIDKLLNNEKNITIEKILEEIKKYNLDNYKRIIIKLENKNYEDIDKLSQIGIDVCIQVSGDRGFCTIEQFKKTREYFNYFINHCSSYNLSNLEKITLAYDYVKFFSYNREITGRKNDSRSIFKSIPYGYVVCEGYSKIFCQLLSEFGINSNLVYTEPNKNEDAGHARVIVKVVDEKYNINCTYAFDPTWDSNMDMSLVQHFDGTKSYEVKEKIKDGDIIIEKLPSEIRYLHYMVPLLEYNKYFPDEKLEKIVRYNTGEKIDAIDDLNKLFNYNDFKPRDDSIINILPELLLKTKKIEGYSDEQIEKYIIHAIELMKQDRFGRLDKYKTQNNGVKKQ